MTSDRSNSVHPRNACGRVEMDASSNQLLAAYRDDASTILEMLVVRQSDPRFDRLLRAVGGGPRAFCGVAAPVLAAKVYRTLAALGMPTAEHDGLEGWVVTEAIPMALSDMDDFERQARDGLECLRASRRKYIAGSPRLRDAKREVRDRYLNAWVANFEVSQQLARCFRQRTTNDDDATGVAVIFVRTNQTPSLSKATHEERERITVDEARFGGRAVGGRPDYSHPSDRAVIVETVRLPPAGIECCASSGNTTTTTTGDLLTIAEFLHLIAASRRTIKAVIAVVDQQGHYVCQLTYRVAESRCVSGAIFNTIAAPTPRGTPNDDGGRSPLPAMSVVAHDIGCAVLDVSSRSCGSSHESASGDPRGNSVAARAPLASAPVAVGSSPTTAIEL